MNSYSSARFGRLLQSCEGVSGIVTHHCREERLGVGTGGYRVTLFWGLGLGFGGIPIGTIPGFEVTFFMAIMQLLFRNDTTLTRPFAISTMIVIVGKFLSASGGCGPASQPTTLISYVGLVHLMLLRRLRLGCDAAATNGATIRS
jgi:hypothetical protein